MWTYWLAWQNIKDSLPFCKLFDENAQNPRCAQRGRGCQLQLVGSKVDVLGLDRYRSLKLCATHSCKKNMNLELLRKFYSGNILYSHVSKKNPFSPISSYHTETVDQSYPEVSII